MRTVIAGGKRILDIAEKFGSVRLGLGSDEARPYRTLDQRSGRAKFHLGLAAATGATKQALLRIMPLSFWLRLRRVLMLFNRPRTRPRPRNRFADNVALSGSGRARRGPEIEHEHEHDLLRDLGIVRAQPPEGSRYNTNLIAERGQHFTSQFELLALT